MINQLWRPAEHGVVIPVVTLIISFFFYSFSTAVVLAEVAVEGGGKTQEMSGIVDDGRGKIYALRDLKKGDTLYAYMTNTGGNLDPMLGVLKQGADRNFLREEVTKRVLESDQNLIEASQNFAAEHFLDWDDDGGSGYDAMLEFVVPADGTYLLMAGSMVTNQHIYTYSPHFTSGSYRLTVSINKPFRNESRDLSTSARFATLDHKFVIENSSVQVLEQRLSANSNFAFHRLKIIQPGDTIHVQLSGTENQRLPRIILSDLGGKPLMFGKADSNSEVATLSYHSKNGDGGLLLFVDGSSIAYSEKEILYTLVVGLNSPEVIHGFAEPRGTAVLKESGHVQIGLSIDQIVNVNQQDETFAVVATLQMIWQQPELAFSPDKCQCGIKKMKLHDLRAISERNNFVIPEYTIFNQQGNRWAQNQIVYVEPSGRTTYRERFTATLQAPDFEFKAYPFDKQIFKVRIDLNVPTVVFAFEEINIPSPPLGEELGEEEWSVFNYYKTIEEIPFTSNLKASRFTMTMEVERHLNYYLFRIFLPLFLIISISWVIFFLKDYGRQLEVASGNLLVFVAFNFAISNDLPRLGYVTLMDRMIITSFICAALVVLISVYQKILESKGRLELASHIDKVVLTFYPLVYISLMVLEYLIVTRLTGLA